MGKKYLVEEINVETETYIKVLFPVIGIGILLLINWSFFKSLTKIDIEIIGILIGIAISLIISLFIFIIKIKDGLLEAIEVTFKWTLGICFSLMLIGSILSPMIGYYIIYNEFEFILWDFIKTILLNTIVLIASSPLIAILITTVSGIIGFILAFPIYKIMYIFKTNRIRKTECWNELKTFINEVDFKNNISKFVLYANKIEFEEKENNKILLFSFTKRGYNNLKKIQQLTLINMIKKETKIKFKIETNPYANIYTVYNKFLITQQKTNEKNYHKDIKRKKQLLKKQQKQKYKKDIKLGKNW